MITVGNRIIICDSRGKEIFNRSLFSGKTIAILALRAEGQVAFVYEDGEIRLFNTHDYTYKSFSLWDNENHFDRVTCAALYKDMIITGTNLSDFAVYNPQNDDLQFIDINGIPDIPSIICVTAEGKIIVGTYNGLIQIFEDLQLGLKLTLKYHIDKITQLICSKDTIIVGSRDSNISVWDFKGNLLKKIKDHLPISTLIVSDNKIISGDVRGFPRVDGKLNSISDIIKLPNGNIMVATLEGLLKIIDLETFETIKMNTGQDKIKYLRLNKKILVITGEQVMSLT